MHKISLDLKNNLPLDSCRKQTPLPSFPPDLVPLSLSFQQSSNHSTRTRVRDGSTRHRAEVTESYHLGTQAKSTADHHTTRHRAPSTHPPTNTSGSKFRASCCRDSRLPSSPPAPVSSLLRLGFPLASPGAPRRHAIAAGAGTGRSAARGTPYRASPKLFEVIPATFCGLAFGGASGGEVLTDACGGLDRGP